MKNQRTADMLILTLSLLLNGPLEAATPKQLVIDSDVAGKLFLPKTRKPHQITRDITIRPTATFKIERGAKIGVAGGVTITLMVDVEIVGDGDEKVGFGPRDRNRAWGGFRVAENAEVALSNLFVVGADTGIQTANRTKLKLSDSLVSRCQTGLELSGGRHEVKNCLVSECTENGIVGLNSFVTLERCTIARCLEMGIELRGKVSLTATDCVVADSDVNLATSSGGGRDEAKLKNTSLLRARTLNVRHRNGQPVHARNCYWGTTDPRLIARSIEDGYDKPALGRVDFTSFLSEAPENVGADTWP